MKFSFHNGEEQSKQYVVRILPHLPLLQMETSLKRYPTLSENPNDSLTEICVFSGQRFFKFLLNNLSTQFDSFIHIVQFKRIHWNKKYNNKN